MSDLYFHGVECGFLTKEASNIFSQDLGGGDWKKNWCRFSNCMGGGILGGGCKADVESCYCNVKMVTLWSLAVVTQTPWGISLDKWLSAFQFFLEYSKVSEKPAFFLHTLLFVILAVSLFKALSRGTRTVFCKSGISLLGALEQKGSAEPGASRHQLLISVWCCD